MRRGGRNGICSLSDVLNKAIKIGLSLIQRFPTNVDTHGFNTYTVWKQELTAHKHTHTHTHTHTNAHIQFQTYQYCAPHQKQLQPSW